MKKAIRILFILFSGLSYSQQLNINETIDYINSKLGTRGNIEITDKGVFKYNKKVIDWDKQSKNSNGELVAPFKTKTYSTAVVELEVNRLSPQYNSGYITSLKCKKNYTCLMGGHTLDKEEEVWLEFGVFEESRDKVFNAFKYLFDLIKETKAYKVTDNDPFANENFKKTYSYVTGIKSKEEIKLERESGVFFIHIEIHGIKKRFVLDSGASEISLSAELEKELIARGILEKENYLEPALYRIADGSIVAKRRVLIKEIKVGDFAINNVTASIGTSNIPLLLGKSFLDKFSKWTIDNNADKLILEK